ncbi:hypothetical protein FW778_14270 [Ginsengibacter hankyongi]|uniref:Uncharacterized protein n=1 Tax=Ginsengibacter hankyongi TaxID=2607284 RepID=A0A5J5IFA6_9BACT|nr:hypothetical protein [Ginsengibacter hankyongi]KAA9038708.1 hypothetical protein FW778_14270 [Ginsengibacter hankyongi]
MTLFATVTFGQTKSSVNPPKKPLSAFKLSLTTFNHATLLFKGTTTYILTAKSIKIIKTSLGKKKGTIVFSKPLLSFQESSASINNFGLDSLKDRYDNYCVMVTSGDEFFLDYNGYSMKKNISLHHYYLKALDDIINIINSYLPKSYQFRYLEKNTRQDCDP